MKNIVETPILQDQQSANEPLPQFIEGIAQDESEKVDRKECLQFLVQQAQELKLGYE